MQHLPAEIGTVMSSRHSLHLRGGTAFAALLLSGALLTAGATPAQASAPPATTLRPVLIETHQTGASSDVHSILIKNVNGIDQCLRYSPHAPNPSIKGSHTGNGQWLAIVVDISWKSTYDVYSFSDNNCTGGNFFIGSHGTISPSVSTKWAVYSSRPPKIAS